jgi:Ig-like domain from next to BRCA1 gene
VIRKPGSLCRLWPGLPNLMDCYRRPTWNAYATSPASLLILFAYFLAACGGSGQGSTPVAFRPPTLESAATPLPTFPPESYIANLPTETPAPTVVPECYNSLSFIEDLTIPDGTVTSPGAVLDKRWRVKNSGTCNWDERYRLKEIAGPDLGAITEQKLYPARSGSEATIRVLFTAPDETGTYRSAWQAYDPEDRPFGDPFFIEVVVQP